MSFLRLLPQIRVHQIEPKGLDESFLTEQFVDRFKAHLTLGGREQGGRSVCTLLAHQSSIQVLNSIE